MDNISPEERLLRLIRKGKKQAAPKQSEQPKAQRSKPVFPYELFSRILAVLCAMLGLYLIFDLLIVNPTEIKAINGAASQIQEKQPAAQASAKPLSFYSDPVKSKHLFSATVETTEQFQTQASFQEMVANLKLQGIISGANPQAVIEDVQSQHVYFLSPGEKINEIELKEILQGKVKLIYQGQEIELSL